MLVCQNRARFPLPLRESDSDSSQISTLTGFSLRARCSKNTEPDKITNNGKIHKNQIRPSNHLICMDSHVLPSAKGY